MSNSFASQGLGQEYVCPMIFLQPWNSPNIFLFSRKVPIIIFTQIRTRTTAGMSGNIYIESQIQRVFSGSTDSTEMSLSAMYGIIPAIFQCLCQRQGMAGPFNTCSRRQSVYVPLRVIQYLMFAVDFLVAVQCPVCYPMPCSVHSGKQANPGRRTYTTRIG